MSPQTTYSVWSPTRVNSKATVFFNNICERPLGTICLMIYMFMQMTQSYIHLMIVLLMPLPILMMISLSYLYGVLTIS